MNYSIDNLGVNSLANNLFPPQNNTPVVQPTTPVVYGTPSVGPMSYGTPNSGMSYGTSASWTPAPTDTPTTPSAPMTYRGIRITPGTDAEISAQVARINAGSGVVTAPTQTPTPTQTTPTTQVPGSAGALPGSNMYTATTDPYEAERARLMGIVGDTSQETDPNTIYQNKLREYQSQIDAINNIYNDQLTNSRIVNAPTYKARLDQNRIGQVMGGLVASPMGAAQTTSIESANNQEQAAAEALIQEKRAQELASIHGQIRSDSSAILAANKLAKTKGAEAMLEFYNVTKPAMKAKQVSTAVRSLISKGIDISTLTPEELNSYTSALGVTKDELMSAYAGEKSSFDSAQLDTKKAEADIAKTTAETNKTNVDAANWGKMTDYQKAQIAIDNYKAKNPTGTDSAKKANALGSIAAELNQNTEIIGKDTMGNPVKTGKYVMDINGFITPEGYKYMVQNAPQIGVEKKDILEAWGQLLYRDKNGGYSAYGLTPADEKILTGALRQ